MTETRQCFFCLKDVNDWVVAVNESWPPEYASYLCCHHCYKRGREQLEAVIYDYLQVRLCNEGLVPRDADVKAAAERERAKVNRLV